MIEKKTDFLQKLKFRRQFLIGPEKFILNKYWDTKKLNHGLVLSIHKDLSYFSKEKNGCRITLIGIAVDCTSPYKTVSKITSDLLEHFGNIVSVIKASRALAGRWVLICQDPATTFIFTDPCGLRQVYYHFNKVNGWYASEPTLINQAKGLAKTTNKSIIKLRKSTQFKEKESAWIGNKTVYKNCFHLMPNHYLDAGNGSQVRFFPGKQIHATKNTEKLVTKASEYLKNIMSGLAYKFDVKISLSGGFDSRLLLAASVDISDEVTFYTDKLGKWKSYHGDIYIPKRLGQKFDLNHEVINSNQEPPPWFCDILSMNISKARTFPFLGKTKSIYSELVNKESDNILINGNVTEIMRISSQRMEYEKSLETKNISFNNSAPLLNYYNYDNNYADNEIERWIKNIDTSAINELSAIDMFYWEQRMGNWGALFPAELDIAAETISPFNCRSLLELCVKVPRDYRKAPEFAFYKGIIKKLWPEILSVPINPGPKGFGLLKKKVREKLPSGIVEFLQKVIS